MTNNYMGVLSNMNISIFICDRTLLSVVKDLTKTCIENKCGINLASSTCCMNLILEKASKSSKNDLYIVSSRDIVSDSNKLFIEKISKIGESNNLIILRRGNDSISKIDSLNISSRRVIDASGDNWQKEYFDSLSDVINEYLDKAADSFVLHTNKTFISIPYDEINYIDTEKQNHARTIYYGNKSASINLSLSVIEQNLDKRFLRCHRSIIVNTDKISEINGEELYIKLKDNKVLPINRNFIKLLKTDKSG